MPTLGKSTTPTTGNAGVSNYTNSANQIGMLFTMPEDGNFQSVSFYIDAVGANHLTVYGCIWNSGGGLIANGSGVSTTGGGTSAATQHWHTDNLQATLFVAAGTQIYIGWQCPTGIQRTWAYNGSDHSPNAFGRNAQGTPSAISGTNPSPLIPAAAVWAYGTYTLPVVITGGIKYDNGNSTFTKHPLKYQRSDGTWQWPPLKEQQSNGTWIRRA